MGEKSCIFEFEPEDDDFEKFSKTIRLETNFYKDKKILKASL